MKLAVLGNPVAHSLSPVLHQAAYAQLGLSHTYEAIEVSEDKFSTFIAGLGADWLGVSLTMPLKEIAFEVAQTISDVAKKTGAINTLVFGETITADNTDVYGISQTLREVNCANPKTATLLGAGATARSAITALAGLGVEDLVVVARNAIKAARCIDLGNELGINIDTMQVPLASLFATDVVINTTPKGVADEYSELLDGVRGLLLDVVYDPWPTRLAQAWQLKGGRIAPGYLMLLHQAARQVEIFTGQSPDIENMRSALYQALAARGIETAP